jgi:hypothetical protein
MDSDTSLITLLVALCASLTTIKLLAGIESEILDIINIRIIRFSAVCADTTNETLGYNANQSGGYHIRLQAHVYETVD